MNKANILLHTAKALLSHVFTWENMILIVMQAHWLNTSNILLKNVQALMLQMLSWENIVLKVMQMHNKKRVIILRRMIKTFMMTFITKEQKIHWTLWAVCVILKLCLQCMIITQLTAWSLMMILTKKDHTKITVNYKLQWYYSTLQF